MVQRQLQEFSQSLPRLVSFPPARSRRGVYDGGQPVVDTGVRYAVTPRSQQANVDRRNFHGWGLLGQMRSDTVQQDPYVSRYVMPGISLQPARCSGKEGVDIERIW